MNHRSRLISPFLAHRRRGLGEGGAGTAWQKLLQKAAAATPVQTAPKRFYRFGHRVNVGGYFVSPKWFDQELLLKEDVKLSAACLQRPDGVVSQANRLFNEEQERQRALVSRIEKIEVILEKPFPTHDDVVLMMNRSISTPYDCAAHISELLRNRSALAVVDGTESWHMHQPLANSCHLRLLHFKHDDPMPVNYAFWRSCSMLLASVVKRAFKEEHPVAILSPPMSDLAGGSFVVDASIASLPDTWTPTTEELRSFTSLLWDEVTANRHFERLQVSADTARRLFAGDAKRLAQIGEASSSSDTTTFTVYRVGDHIELCEEALIASTGLIGSIFTSAVHRISTPNGGTFYRFQGVALPRQLHINAYAFSLIRDRAKQLNSVGLS